MNWNEVKIWLHCHNHINEHQWEVIEVNDDNLYCSDTVENTFFSLFTRSDGELIMFVGMLQPKVSVGGPTGIYVENYHDVIDFLIDHMDDMYDELMRKVVNE